MSHKSGPSKAVSLLIIVVMFCAFFYVTTGLFVIQPIGAIPDGVTIWYWRAGTTLPFISSADGLLLETEGGVSLLGRGLALAAMSEVIIQRKILALPYSRSLYLVSTDGQEYVR